MDCNIFNCFIYLVEFEFILNILSHKKTKKVKIKKEDLNLQSGEQK